MAALRDELQTSIRAFYDDPQTEVELNSAQTGYHLLLRIRRPNRRRAEWVYPLTRYIAEFHPRVKLKSISAFANGQTIQNDSGGRDDAPPGALLLRPRTQSPRSGEGAGGTTRLQVHCLGAVPSERRRAGGTTRLQVHCLGAVASKRRGAGGTMRPQVHCYCAPGRSPLGAAGGRRDNARPGALLLRPRTQSPRSGEGAGGTTRLQVHCLGAVASKRRGAGGTTRLQVHCLGAVPSKRRGAGGTMRAQVHCYCAPGRSSLEAAGGGRDNAPPGALPGRSPPGREVEQEQLDTRLKPTRLLLLLDAVETLLVFRKPPDPLEIQKARDSLARGLPYKPARVTIVVLTSAGG